MALVNIGVCKNILLDSVAQGASLKQACNFAQVSAGAHYAWLANDPAYAAAWKQALVMRTDLIEDEAVKRTIEGAEEVTEYYRLNPDTGQMELSERRVSNRKSDAILLRLLEAGNPERFSKRIKKDVTTTVTVADTLAAARQRLSAAREKATSE